jgi:hypothetical protein
MILRRFLIPALVGAILAAGGAYVMAMNDFLSSERFGQIYGLPSSEQNMEGWLKVHDRLVPWVVIMGGIGAVAAVSLTFMVRMSREG